MSISNDFPVTRPTPFDLSFFHAIGCLTMIPHSYQSSSRGYTEAKPCRARAGRTWSKRRGSLHRISPKHNIETPDPRVPSQVRMRAVVHYTGSRSPHLSAVTDSAPAPVAHTPVAFQAVVARAARQLCKRTWQPPSSNGPYTPTMPLQRSLFLHLLLTRGNPVCS